MIVCKMEPDMNDQDRLSPEQALQEHEATLVIATAGLALASSSVIPGLEWS
jgi:hypothetical protein